MRKKFKMKGYSPFTKETNLPEEEQQRITDANKKKTHKLVNRRDSIKKTYPKSYTKEDIEFLRKQMEDVVRYEDLDAKGKEIWNKLRDKKK